MAKHHGVLSSFAPPNLSIRQCHQWQAQAEELHSSWTEAVRQLLSLFAQQETDLEAAVQLGYGQLQADIASYKFMSEEEAAAMLAAEVRGWPANKADGLEQMCPSNICSC